MDTLSGLTAIEAQTSTGVAHEDDDDNDDDATAEAAEAALRLMTGCSIVVGMHPDQAAGPIVDMAIALGKPFGESR